MPAFGFLDGFDRDHATLTLPDGSTHRCTAPTLKDAAEVMRLYQRVEVEGDLAAWADLTEVFPRAVGLDVKTFAELQMAPGDFLRLVSGFFTLTSPEANGAKPPPSPAS